MPSPPPPSEPRGVQLRRVAGWTLPPRTRSVARPTRWGNPWAVDTGDVRASGYMRGPGAGFYGGDREYLYDVALPRRLTAEEAVGIYRHDLVMTLDDPDPCFDEVRDALAGLAGWNLACWCPLGAPCHRDVLLDLANR